MWTRELKLLLKMSIQELSIECMRHLWKNMKKSYSGTLYGKNMWAAAKSFTTDKFNFFMRNIEEKDPRHLSGWMRTIHPYGVEAHSQKTAR